MDNTRSYEHERNIRSVTYLKNRVADLLDQINETRRPVVITQNGEARAVVQDPDSYQRMRASIGLLKLLAQAEDDVRAGRTIDQKALFSKIKSEQTRAKRGGSPSVSGTVDQNCGSRS